MRLNKPKNDGQHLKALTTHFRAMYSALDVDALGKSVMAAVTGGETFPARGYRNALWEALPCSTQVDALVQEAFMHVCMPLMRKGL